MLITREDAYIRDELLKHTAEELIDFRKKLRKIDTPRSWAIRFHIIAVLLEYYLRGDEFSKADRKEFEDFAQAARIDRLMSGDWSFGCPIEPHHHHDAFCKSPTSYELEKAGIDPKIFKRRRRG